MDSALHNVVRQGQNKNRCHNAPKSSRDGIKKRRSTNNKRGHKPAALSKGPAPGNGINKGARFNKRTHTNKRNTNKDTQNVSTGEQSPNPLPTTGTKLKVNNIHYDIAEEELLSFFKQKGRVEHIELLHDRNGKSTGKCFVTYTHESDAMEAIRDYNGQVAQARPLSVAVVA